MIGGISLCICAVSGQEGKLTRVFSPIARVEQASADRYERVIKLGLEGAVSVRVYNLAPSTIRITTPSLEIRPSPRDSPAMRPDRRYLCDSERF